MLGQLCFELSDALACLPQLCSRMLQLTARIAEMQRSRSKHCVGHERMTHTGLQYRGELQAAGVHGAGAAMPVCVLSGMGAEGGRVRRTILTRPPSRTRRDRMQRG